MPSISLKKQEHRSIVQQIFYSPISSFFLFDGIVGSVRVELFLSLRRIHINFYGFWIKLFSHKLAREFSSSIRKNLAQQF